MRNYSDIDMYLYGSLNVENLKARAPSTFDQDELIKDRFCFYFKGERKMGIPQIIMIVLFAMGLGITLIKNGEPRTDNYSFGMSFVATVIQVALLWWGGFFE